MRHSLRTRPFYLSLTLACLLAAGAQAQDAISAKDALAKVARNYGPSATAAIVEMTGTFGQDQPESWSLVAWDESATFNLRAYSIERGDVTDGGEDYSRLYPENPPTGFIPLDKLKIDSTLAFEIAEKQARAARMGFNSLNYSLAAMEYATEPVWALDLVDADDDLAGKVFISGETGEVLRTVFIYRNDPLNLRIVDSAAPRTTEATTTAAPEPEQVIIGTTPPGGIAPAPMESLIPAPATPPSDSIAPPPSTSIPPAPPLSPAPPQPIIPTPSGDRVIPPPPIPLEP